MNLFIFTTFLFLGFAIGDVIGQKIKLPGPFSVSENNVPGSGSRNRGINFDELIRNLLKLVRDSNLDIHNSTNSSVRKYSQGKTKGTNEIIFPLVLFFKFVGVLFLSLVIVKFFLFKGVFVAKIAVIILGIVFAKKLRRFGTLMLLKNHQLHFEYGPGQYPTNEQNLSGYGYEYNFIPDFQTPEQKYSSLTGKEGNKRNAKYTK